MTAWVLVSRLTIILATAKVVTNGGYSDGDISPWETNHVPIGIQFHWPLPFSPGASRYAFTVTGLVWMMEISCFSKFIFAPLDCQITDSDPLYLQRLTMGFPNIVFLEFPSRGYSPPTEHHQLP